MKWSMFSLFCRPGFGWFRLFGYGLHWKDSSRHRLLFSERVLGHGLTVRGWHFRLLAR